MTTDPAMFIEGVVAKKPRSMPSSFEIVEAEITPDLHSRTQLRKMVPDPHRYKSHALNILTSDPAMFTERVFATARFQVHLRLS